MVAQRLSKVKVPTSILEKLHKKNTNDRILNLYVKRDKILEEYVTRFYGSRLVVEKLENNKDAEYIATRILANPIFKTKQHVGDQRLQYILEQMKEVTENQNYEEMVDQMTNLLFETIDRLAHLAYNEDVKKQVDLITYIYKRKTS